MGPQLLTERTADAERLSVRLTASEREHDASDVGLVARMARGDERAAGLLYDAHSARLFGLAHAMVRERADAEEVILDAFTKAWHEAARFDASRGTVLAWLTTIVRSRSLDLIRARMRRARAHERAGVYTAIEADVDASGKSAIDLATATFDAEALSVELARAVRTLPAAQRQIVELAFLGGVSHSKIAAQLGLPLGTVKTRARMALRGMRAVLEASANR